MIVLSSKLNESYGGQNNPEAPIRLVATRQYLTDKGLDITEDSTSAIEKELLLIHSQEHLFRLKNSLQEEQDCPPYPQMFSYASRAAGLALQAGKIAISGDNTFSLMRPPGHHASKDSSRGFCYINNAALVAVYLRNQIGKVAIVDIDNHHGNGTQELVSGLEDILFVDLHRHPDYPHTGEESFDNCLNFPLPTQVGEKGYLLVLDTAIKKVEEFRPEIVVVSAGFDTFKKDPIGNLGLDTTSYSKIGKTLKKIGVPTCSVLEGGYNVEGLPQCILSYITGLQ